MKKMLTKIYYGKDKSSVINDIENRIERMEKLYTDVEDYCMIQYFKGHIQAYKECIRLIKQMK